VAAAHCGARADQPCIAIAVAVARSIDLTEAALAIARVSCDTGAVFDTERGHGDIPIKIRDLLR
jgi:hypothetical protein